MAEPPKSSSGTTDHGFQGHLHPLAPTIIPSDWPVQAADQIVDTIAKVRDRTTRPALVAARAVVYGLIIAVVGIVALVLVITLVVRLYDVYVPGPVWPIYALISIASSLGGLVLLHRANKPASAVEPAA